MSQRRRFALALLTPAVMAIAGCASGSTVARSDDPPPSADAGSFRFAGDFAGPLGVQLYSFRDAFRTDVPGTLARVRALGFREVELAGTYGLTAAAFRARLDAAGLRATSMHVGYERLRDSLSVVLADAKTLGARYVGVAWIPHPAGAMTAAQASVAAADFTRWGRAARAEGVTFFYHVHGYEFQPGPNGDRPMDVLMRETDRDAVKYEMDVFWVARPGADPAALLRQYPGRWALMHLKDMRQGTATNVHTGSAPANESEVPVGTGQIDYRAVLRAARETGVSRYYLEDETSDPFATVPRSTQWLERVRG